MTKIFQIKITVLLQTIQSQRALGKILQDGGNAIDASVGVSYALAITEPHSSGLGGGAMLAMMANKMLHQNNGNTKIYHLLILNKKTR